MAEAGVGVMPLKTKERQGSLAMHEAEREAWGTEPRENQPCTPDFSLLTSRMLRECFSVVFQPPCSQQGIPTALGT